MTRSISPKCTRVFSILSVSFSGFSILLYLFLILIQDVYKASLGLPQEIIGYFVFPIAPLFSVLPIFLVQTVFCIVLIASGKKAIWGVGAGLTFSVVEGALFAVKPLLLTALNILDTQRAGIYGAAYLAANSSVSGICSMALNFFTFSEIFALIAFSILTYKAALDKRCKAPMGGF